MSNNRDKWNNEIKHNNAERPAAPDAGELFIHDNQAQLFSDDIGALDIPDKTPGELLQIELDARRTRPVSNKYCPLFDKTTDRLKF